MVQQILRVFWVELNDALGSTEYREGLCGVSW